MKILIPKPLANPNTPQWWVISFTWHRQKSFRYLDLFLRTPWVSLQYRRNAPVDDPTQLPKFVGRTFYDVFYIVHPNGGSVCRIRCQSCGADYPWPKNPLFSPCGFCAVERETRLRVWWQRERIPRPGVSMYKRYREWPKANDRGGVNAAD